MKEDIIFEIIDKELERQQNFVELIASENIVSQDVLRAQGSILTNKYAEGYPGKRYYGGCHHVDSVENLAIERLNELFKCSFSNVQPHSGSQANSAVYTGLLNPKDTILGMSLDAGGHLTHGFKASYSGKVYNAHHYGTNEEGILDYDNVMGIAKSVKPKLIIAGASAYSRSIDFEYFSKIAKQVGAILMVDMAHIAGLVATGAHQNPLPYADVVTSTTHKTLRGPRGGIVLTNHKDIIKKVNSAIFPGTQGGPLMHIIAAKAVAFKEASSNSFKDYINNVIINAKAMSDFFKSSGIEVVSNGTDNHMMIINLSSYNTTGDFLEKTLDLIGITCNKNTIPNDPNSSSVTSGIRIGTPAITTRGYQVEDCLEIAAIIKDVIMLTKGNISIDESNLAVLKGKVHSINSNFPIYQS